MGEDKMRTIIAFLTTLLVCTKFACGQSFKSDAANFVEVEYRKRNSVEDITEVEVHVRRGQVLETCDRRTCETRKEVQVEDEHPSLFEIQLPSRSSIQLLLLYKLPGSSH